ncbi:hypothetical protein As57867_012875, partial [Aphanomyces stellatus]
MRLALLFALASLARGAPVAYGQPPGYSQSLLEAESEVVAEAADVAGYAPPPGYGSPYGKPPAYGKPPGYVPPPNPAPVPAPYPVPVPPSSVCTFVDGDVLTLQADSGKYLDRCNNCVPKGAYPDSSTVHVTNPASESWGTWKVFNTGSGKIALQGDAGKYLSRCQGCAPNGAAYPDQAFVHASDWRDNPPAQWTCIDVGGGKIALRADSGNYLARCNNCIPGAAYVDQTFVHVSDWRGKDWAQWTVRDLTPHYVQPPAPQPYPLPVPQPIPVPPSYPQPVPVPVYPKPLPPAPQPTHYPVPQPNYGPVPQPPPYTVPQPPYNPKPYNPFPHSDYGLQPNYPVVVPSYIQPSSAYSRALYLNDDAQLVQVPAPNACTFFDGDVLTLQSDTGKYLDRCYTCNPLVFNSQYFDSATVHVTNPATESWGTWRVYNTGDGRLALQANSGNYLARCAGCAPTAVPGPTYRDQAFVHVSDWHGKDWAQWRCYDVGGGKIALQADTGNYLARCNNCIIGALYPDTAFVHVTDWRDKSWAQWTVRNLTPHPL